MKRYILDLLQQWKTKPNRKPLIIQGARQVGKTWAMKHFGEHAFDQVAYINFDNNPRMKTLFEGDYNIDRLILGLKIESGVDIQAENTLIILIKSKKFHKRFPPSNIFMKMHRTFILLLPAHCLESLSIIKFPSLWGKWILCPFILMDFREFLLAMGKQDLVQLLEMRDWALINAMKSTYIDLLRQYYFVGGMPEAVKTFVETQNLNDVRQVQRNLLMAYEQDFSKHIRDGQTVQRVRALWNSIPEQLAKENKKIRLFPTAKRRAQQGL